MKIVIVVLLALITSACIVSTPAGDYDCTGIPQNGVMIVICTPIQHASLP